MIIIIIIIIIIIWNLYANYSSYIYTLWIEMFMLNCNTICVQTSDK